MLGFSGSVILQFSTLYHTLLFYLLPPLSLPPKPSAWADPSWPLPRPQGIPLSPALSYS